MKTNFTYKFYLISFIMSLGLVACSNNDDLDSDPTALPATRPFFMGFTAFPYDNTQEAQIESAESVIANGEILLAHFDHGVPWNEALNDLPFPEEIQNTMAGIKNAVALPNKIVLTATATNQSRDALADYWNNDGSHQPLSAPWNGYSFNEPDVITAYLKYCRRIIDEIQPTHFAYGIEINSSFKKSTPAFENYLVFAETVYSTLKSEYPNMNIYLTFQDQSFNKTKEEVHEMTTTLLPYSDMIAVSTYPFWLYDFPSQDANPALLNDNWLKEMRDLAPNKPFAISETGYIAEDLNIPSVGVSVKGTPEWQADYAQKLMRQAHELRAEHVLWFVYRDYDLLYQNTPNPPFFFLIWKDNGLLDGGGNRRAAHTVWDKWRALPIEFFISN